MPEDHEGREAYGIRPDPTPDKGRALGRLEEKQGRQIAKGHRGNSAAKGGGDKDDDDEADGPRTVPLGGG